MHVEWDNLGGNNPPTVQITSPASGATFEVGQTISITADATDTDGSVTKVEFFQGSTKLGEDLTSPYSYNWTNAAAGSYNLTAKATDDGGAATTSAAVSITVQDTSGGSSPWTVSGNDIYFTGGKVGVGTSTQGDDFDVSSNTGSTQLRLQNTQVGGGVWHLGATDNGSAGGGGNLIFVPNSTSSANATVVFQNSGNLGIGTTNPTNKLEVNGTIKAKEVIVSTQGWSDFVFDDDYNLMPLDSLEAHIQQHKHLPGIPSAQEVETGGVKVAEMQAKLLQKIEELTLYVIKQEKRMQALADENKTLKARITAVENN